MSQNLVTDTLGGPLKQRFPLQALSEQLIGTGIYYWKWVDTTAQLMFHKSMQYLDCTQYYSNVYYYSAIAT